MTHRGGWGSGRGDGRSSARDRLDALPRRQDARVLLPRALRYLLPYWAPAAVIVVCLIAAASLVAVPPLLIREIIDVALPDGDRGLLNLLVLASIGLYVASGLIGVLQNFLNTLVSQRIMLDIRNQLYTHLQYLSLRFFTKNRTGEIMSRVTDDVDAIQNTVTGSLISIASNFFTVAITLIVIFTLNWQLALISVSLLPLFIIPTRMVGRVRRNLRRKTQEARAELNTQMQETLNISGFLLMKVFGREKDEAHSFRTRSREVMDLQVRQGLVGRWFFMLLGLFSFIGPAIIYWYGGYQVITGALTIGTIVAFVAYLARLYGPVTSLATVYVDVQAALAVFERIFEYLDTRSEVIEATDPVYLDQVRGSIEFESVSFEYAPGRSALRDISFVVEPGNMAALVGPSGAGKSTITYLIPRFYDPTEGTISLDGRRLQDIRLDSLRSWMGTVSQETFLFNTTIRENLLYGRPGATDTELVAACEAAHLQDFIAGLPDRYETVVGERGYRLSGGEKQRLAIARVILKNPRIVILDEATSHLDSLAESAIRSALVPLLQGCTSVVIAHRLSTILRADTILVLDRGRLVEQGTHAELLDGGGLYARIYEEQFRPQEEGIPISHPP